MRLRIQAIVDSISANRPDDVTDIVPAYTSVAVHYAPSPPGSDTAQRITELSRLISSGGGRPRESRLVELPVSYGGDHGPDLEDVARHTGLDPEEVVRLHAGSEYVVSMIGFVPGFPYLAGLPPVLATPRLPAPRKRVPAGSVAIGGDQAGIYPLETAGGWRIIGRTSTRLFDPHAAEPTLLRAGDRVRFVPVSR